VDAHEILIMVELAIVVGIVGFVVSDRLRLPSIVFLMGLGILVGPEVFNLVNPRELGDGLRVLVSIAVGIIVFEGGMLLDFREMRAATPPIRNLITLGVVIAVIGGTLVAWLVAGLPLPLAALYGGLMSVTGPTVITPLLKRAKVNRRLSTILQSEAVLVDAIGAVLAVVILEIVLEPSGAILQEGLQGVVTRLAVGSVIGVLGGYGVAWILKRLDTLGAETVRLAALGGALAIYDLAEVFAAESGIAAVALAGIIVGNADIPFKSQIKRFKGDLTNLGIILLFVLLAAGLRFDTFTAFQFDGFGGVLALLAMMLMVRPVSVFVSMLGTNVPMRERLYMAALGPRGVVAAAIALFAEIELTANSYPGVESFIGLVYMTIIGTVVIQGLAAAPLARILGATSMQVLVVSADSIGRELANRLMQNDISVTLIDTDKGMVERARREDLDAIHGDGTSEEDLQRAGIKQATKFVAATSSDSKNLLACQIAKQKFGITNLVARVNDPTNLDSFEALGVDAVSPVVSTAMLLDNLVRRPAATELLVSQTPGQEVAEAQLFNHQLIGKPLKNWSLEGDVLVVMARRDGNLFVVHGDTEMQKGDLLTLIGKEDDVQKCMHLIEGA